MQRKEVGLHHPTAMRMRSFLVCKTNQHALQQKARENSGNELAEKLNADLSNPLMPQEIMTPPRWFLCFSVRAMLQHPHLSTLSAIATVEQSLSQGFWYSSALVSWKLVVRLIPHESLAMVFVGRMVRTPYG